MVGKRYRVDKKICRLFCGYRANEDCNRKRKLVNENSASGRFNYARNW